MQPVLYMLIGPKGAGKTSIGMLVDRHTDIKFIRVESVWLSLAPDENGWRKVEETIDRAFEAHDKVMVESLGVGEDFRQFHASLAAKYSIRLIRVFADPDTCLTRVRSRNSADHIAISDDQIMEYNTIAAQATYAWDLEIDNNAPGLPDGIIKVIRSI